MLLATRSRGKLGELRPLFARRGIDVIDLAAAGLPELPEEEEIEAHESFEENALAKARYFHRRSGGMPTMADDSGLEVAALGGRPGVRSRRWSGRADLAGDALDAANNALLVSSMAEQFDRRARYVCAAAFVDGRRELVRLGTVAGAIVQAPRGREGFGYDPYFEADELGGRTFGEVGTAEKERVSHRGRAFTELLGALVESG